VGSDVAVETGSSVDVIEEAALLPHAERRNANTTIHDQCILIFFIEFLYK
jgi:hypothetical protein